MSRSISPPARRISFDPNRTRPLPGLPRLLSSRSTITSDDRTLNSDANPEGSKVNYKGLTDVPTGPRKSISEGLATAEKRSSVASERFPHIFIPYESLPIARDRAPRHLRGFLNNCRVNDIIATTRGFYVHFDDSVTGRDMLKRCYRLYDHKVMFGEYVIRMEVHMDRGTGRKEAAVATNEVEGETKSAQTPRMPSSVLNNETSDLASVHPARQPIVAGSETSKLELLYPSQQQVFPGNIGTKQATIHPSRQVLLASNKDSGLECVHPARQAVIAGTKRLEVESVHLSRQTSIINSASAKSKDDSASVSSVSGNSSRSASRKMCHMCKNASALDLEPLVRCSTCPRRYHRHCHARPPIPTGLTEAHNWQCRRCASKGVLPLSGALAADSASTADITRRKTATEATSEPRQLSHCPNAQSEAVHSMSSDGLGGLVDRSFEVVEAPATEPTTARDPRLSLYNRVKKRQPTEASDRSGLQTIELAPVIAPAQSAAPVEVSGLGNGSSTKATSTSYQPTLDNPTAAAGNDPPQAQLIAKPKVAVRKSSGPAIVPCSECGIQRVFRGPAGTNTLCVDCKNKKSEESETPVAELETLLAASTPKIASSSTPPEVEDTTGVGMTEEETQCQMQIPAENSNKPSNLNMEKISTPASRKKLGGPLAIGVSTEPGAKLTEGNDMDAIHSPEVRRSPTEPASGHADTTQTPGLGQMEPPSQPVLRPPQAAAMRRPSSDTGDRVEPSTNLDQASDQVSITCLYPIVALALTSSKLEQRAGGSAKTPLGSRQNRGRKSSLLYKASLQTQTSAPVNDLPAPSSDTRRRKKGLAMPVRKPARKSVSFSPTRRRWGMHDKGNNDGETRREEPMQSLQRSETQERTRAPNEPVTAVESAVTEQAAPEIVTPDKRTSTEMEGIEGGCDADLSARKDDTLGPVQPSRSRRFPAPRLLQLSGKECDLGNADDRPRGAYRIMTGMALRQAHDYRLQATSIIEWIETNVPGYETGKDTWGPSINATLSTHKEGQMEPLWRKIPLSEELPGDNGKGCWWKLLDGIEAKLHKWDRRKKEPISPEMQSMANTPGAVTVLRYCPEKRKLSQVATASAQIDGLATKRVRRDQYPQPGEDDPMLAPPRPAADLTSDAEPLVREFPRNVSRSQATEVPRDKSKSIDSVNAHHAPHDEGFHVPARTSAVIVPGPRASTLRVGNERHLSLEEFIRRDVDNIEYGEKSLFAAYPEYLITDASRAQKKREISKRPNRKALIGQPANVSRLRLGQPIKREPSLMSIKRRASPSRRAPERVCDSRPFSWREEEEDEGAIRQRVEYQDIDSFFDLPVKATPVWYNGQLAYRDGMSTGDGRLSRAKVLYKPE